MSTVVVIPNWNGARLLARYLPSVIGQQGLVRVLVVDNGSADDSVAVARSLGAEVLALPSNLGFAAAVNAGVQETQEPWVAVVNNDVWLAPDWLATLKQAMEETGAALGSGRIWRDGDDEAEAPAGEPRRRSGGLNQDAIDGTFDLLSSGATAWRVGAGWRRDEPRAAQLSQRRSVKLVSLTAALVRRGVFEQAGLLDVDFESYLEDVEFSLRCARLGLKAVYEPAAEAWHRGSATLGAWHPETARRIARNQLMIVAKHYPSGWLARYGRAILSGQLLWGGVAVKHGAGLSYLRGKWQGLAGFSKWRNASSWARREDDLAGILAEMEADLRALRADGDAYWRWYFRLSGGAKFGI